MTAERRPGRLVFELPPPGGVGRVAFALGQLPVMAFAAAAVWVAWFYLLPVLREQDDIPPAMIAYMQTGGAFFAGLGLLSMIHAARAAFGRTRVVLGEGCIAVEERLGPFPDVAWFKKGAARTRRAALLRLLSVEFEGVAGPTTLALTTPVRTIRAEWELPVADDREFRARLVAELRDRLQHVQRDVTEQGDLFEAALAEGGTERLLGL